MDKDLFEVKTGRAIDKILDARGRMLGLQLYSDSKTFQAAWDISESLIDAIRNIKMEGE